MKKLFKQSLAVLLSATLLLTAATFASSAAEMAPQEESVGAESGKTGDCTWTLDNTGTLTISGNGAMKDYNAYSPNSLLDASPWGPWTGLSVKKVVIGDGVTHIGDFAFTDCIRLTSVTIPDSVTSIGGYAFDNCTGLTSVSIPDSVTTIDRGAFFGCTGLTSITIPDSVTSIGDFAFYNCTGLTSVTIPDSVTFIGSEAFECCTGLTSITIPDSLANIEGYAFNNTAWYNNQPDGMVYAGRVAYKYKGTMPDNTSIIIRDGTKGIAGSAFERCNGLRSVIIPDSVTSIGFGSLGYNWGRKKIDGLTIYGVPGSAAEQYANDNGFTFIEYVDAAIGDMTGDGKVNVRDVTAMQRHLAGLEELTDDRLALADVNADGKVTIDDVTLLQRYLAEFDVTIG